MNQPAVAVAPRPKDYATVAGLGVARWAAPEGRPAGTVVALAGLGGSSANWNHLAAALPDRDFVGPDLRGRGASVGVAGPPGLRAHARDVSRVMDELDLTDVVLVGHSMGAYLAPIVAQEAAGRVQRLVLIDGGIRPHLPAFLPARLVRRQFRRELGGADREWPSVEAFAAKARLAGMLTSRPDLRAPILTILREELGGGAGPLRPRVDVEHAVGDAMDCFFGADVPAAVDAMQVPARVLLAEHKKTDRQKPFISDRAVREWVRRQPRFDVSRLPGNHLTVLFAPEVVEAVTT